MEYKNPTEAHHMSGLRIALTTGLPAPWSMAARFMFEVKKIPYVPVAQLGGQANEDLVAWTGHRNAPVVMLDDEPARTNWADIIQLAERLEPEPQLVPDDPEERIRMFGLCNEICGAGGLTWNARLLMLDNAMKAAKGTPQAATLTMTNAYGYSTATVARAMPRIIQIFDLLQQQLKSQKSQGHRYFIGSKLTALDLIWASFSNTLRPLPEDVNPMNRGMRKAYQGMGDVLNPPEILFEHRDNIYGKHIPLPLDF